MSIVYDPKSMLKKIAPVAKIKRMLKDDLDLKRAALTFVDAVEFIDKKAVARVALETIKNYKSRVSAEDATAGELKKDPKLLIARVQNEVVFQISKEISQKYEGEQYEWLPSDAEEPDPEHQLNYGKVFTIGDGEMPGERFGCRCGMRILVKQTQLRLD